MVFYDWIRKEFLQEENEKQLRKNWLFYRFTVLDMKAAWEAGYEAGGGVVNQKEEDDE